MRAEAGDDATRFRPWVREAYWPQAVETAEQEAWVEWFGRWARNASSAARR